MRPIISLLFLSSAAMSAQSQPAFEVASVRPNKSGTMQANVGMPPNGVDFVNLPLRGIIQLAYGINQPSKLVGVPDWTATERFDISARASEPITLEERRLMLQTLLAERFELVARRETREISVLALMLAREDGKLGENLVVSTGCFDRINLAQGKQPERPDTPICGPKTGGAGGLLLTGVPMQQFTSLLSLVIGGRPIVDKTGLTGRYDIDLKFAPERPAPGVEVEGPSVYTAVREQLGLKLEAQKEMEEVLVIEHLERQPTEN